MRPSRPWSLTALQLEQALKTPAHVWLNLQAQYELTQARLAAQGGRRRAVPAEFGFAKKKAKKK